MSLDSTSGATVASAVTAINAKTAAYGIYAVANSAGTGISFQSQSSFSIADNNNTASKGVFNNATTGAVAAPFTSTAPVSSGDGTSSISAIDHAIKSLGLVQGTVARVRTNFTTRSALPSRRFLTSRPLKARFATPMSRRTLPI